MKCRPVVASSKSGSTSVVFEKMICSPHISFPVVLAPVSGVIFPTMLPRQPLLDWSFLKSVCPFATPTTKKRFEIF